MVTRRLDTGSAPNDVDTMTGGLAIAGSGSVDTIGTTKVADSAKIVLIENYAGSNANFKVITGKQLKTLAFDGDRKSVV